MAQEHYLHGISLKKDEEELLQILKEKGITLIEIFREGLKAYKRKHIATQTQQIEGE